MGPSVMIPKTWYNAPPPVAGTQRVCNEGSDVMDSFG